jgi:hypothetical protein
MKLLFAKTGSTQREQAGGAPSRSAGERSPALQIVNMRADAIAQRRLQESLLSSPRQHHLIQQQAVAGARTAPGQARQLSQAGAGAGEEVVQRHGGSTAPYSAHKEGEGETKWDNATDKKKEIWEEMDRDGFQEQTKDLLGVSKETETPTTNHILSKSKLPQFEFKLANLRLGPNSALRGDDPDQAPDYNLGHDGELTPRSKRIATSFESGNKEKLREAFSEEGHRKVEQADFDQWYISRSDWEKIASDWEKKQEFWETYQEDYYVVDYSSKVDDGRKGEVIPGIPWMMTKHIAKVEHGKFKDLKKFISRGGKVQNPDQKEVLNAFRAFKESKIEQLVERYQLQDGVELAKGIDASDVKRLGPRYAKTCEKLCAPFLQELSQFNFKTDSAKEKLDSFYQQLNAKCENALKLGWNDATEEQRKRNSIGLTKALSEAHTDWLRDTETLWLAEFKTTKTDRQAPYHLTGEERTSHLAEASAGALQTVLKDKRKELLVGDDLLLSNENLQEFMSPFLQHMMIEKGKICESIDKYEKEGVASKFSVDQIKLQLAVYGIDTKLRVGKQPKTIPNVAAFLTDAKRWCGAEKWINQFQETKTPVEANKDLHNLLKQLISKYETG